MRRGLHSGPLLSEHLLRGMAVFFLLFTCTDIVFPPPCSETKECLAACKIVAALQAKDVINVNSRALVGNKDLDSNRSPGQECRDEDCCFGCAHMLSIAAVTGVVVFDIRSSGPIPAPDFLPMPDRIQD